MAATFFGLGCSYLSCTNFDSFPKTAIGVRFVHNVAHLKQQWMTTVKSGNSTKKYIITSNKRRKVQQRCRKGLFECLNRKPR